MSLAERIARLEQRICDKSMPPAADGTHPIMCISLDDDDRDSDAPYQFSCGERTWIQQPGETFEAAQERALAEVEKMVPPDRSVALVLHSERVQSAG
jgi:hypothetical protein